MPDAVDSLKIHTHYSEVTSSRRNDMKQMVGISAAKEYFGNNAICKASIYYFTTIYYHTYD